MRLHRAMLLCGAMCVACSSGSSDPATLTLYGRFDATQGLPELSMHHDRGGADDLYLVQFIGPIDPTRRAAIIAAGAKLVRYFPEDAFVVRAGSAQASTLWRLEGVRTVQYFPDQLRLSPKLLTAAGDLDLSASTPTVVSIEVSHAAAVPQLLQDIEGLGGQVLRAPTFGRVVRAALTSAQIQELLVNLDIEAVEPFTPVHPHNAYEYGILQAGEPNTSPIWAAGLYGNGLTANAGQIVAISDGALVADPITSCRFQQSKYTKLLKYIEEPDATFTNPNTFLHGTHVAGIVAGDNLNDGLYESEDGMAPATQLYFEALGDNLSGLPSDLSDLFTPAFQAGAYIHNNSWGNSDSSYDTMARSVDAFVYENPSYLLVFSAGNDGGSRAISSPGLAKNCLSVGSMDDVNDVSFFSSQGPTADGRIKPDVVAMGNDVMSAAWSSDLAATPPGDATCGTVAWTGTSVAAPNISGAAAMVRQYYNDGFYPSGNANVSNAYTYPSAALLRATIIASAQNMGANGNNTGGDFPASGQGFGRPQLNQALYLGSATQRLFAVDTTTGLNTGSTKTYTFQVNYDLPLKFVLVWSDPEAALTAGKSLVNNLDMTVTDPSGNVYRGNIMTNGVSVPTNLTDTNNTTEIFYVPTANVTNNGTYTVTVSGQNVPGDPTDQETAAQNYALVGLGAFAATDLTPLVNDPSQDPNNGLGGGASVGPATGNAGGDGYDPESGAAADGGVAPQSGCTAAAPNNALLFLLIGLWYLLPKPPPRRRARIKRQ